MRARVLCYIVICFCGWHTRILFCHFGRFIRLVFLLCPSFLALFTRHRRFNRFNPNLYAEVRGVVAYETLGLFTVAGISLNNLLYWLAHISSCAMCTVSAICSHLCCCPSSTLVVFLCYVIILVQGKV